MFLSLNHNLSLSVGSLWATQRKYISLCAQISVILSDTRQKYSHIKINQINNHKKLCRPLSCHYQVCFKNFAILRLDSHQSKVPRLEFGGKYSRWLTNQQSFKYFNSIKLYIKTTYQKSYQQELTNYFSYGCLIFFKNCRK